ncbi:hypothetical protein KC319_g16834, partial [Hortaea werneckii]
EYHPVIVHANGLQEAYPPGGVLPEEHAQHQHQQLQQQQQQHKVPYSANKPAEPIRADSGFQSYHYAQPAPPTQGPPYHHHELHPAYQQQQPQHPPPPPHHTYALQTGHDPSARFYPPPTNHEYQHHHQQQQQQQQHQDRHPATDMGRLEALVAVATSEGRAGPGSRS